MAAVSLLVLLAALVPNVQAATITVNSLNDPGDGVCNTSKCTLREAIDAASVGGTIDFSETGTIELSDGELVIDKSLVITGPHAGSLTIDALGDSRVFYLTSGDVSIGVQDDDGCPDASGTEIDVKPSSINPSARASYPLWYLAALAWTSQRST